MVGNRIYSREQLEDRLSNLTNEELIALVSKLYVYCPDAQSIINQAAVTREPADDVLSHMEDYTPGECKTALSAHIKTIKDRKGKVLCYFSFVEWILDRRETLDHRFISVASSAFGKAMDILAKDKALWDELLEQSYAIAGRFYEMDGAAAYKAVEYYSRVKRGYDRST